MPFIAHELTHEPTPTHENLEWWQAAQRLKQYKKRYARHYQVKLSKERKGEPVSKRTINALENNKAWIKYFEQMVSVGNSVKQSNFQEAV